MLKNYMRLAKGQRWGSFCVPMATFLEKLLEATRQWWAKQGANLGGTMDVTECYTAAIEHQKSSMYRHIYPGNQ